jgi:hypothetical protein
MKKTLPLLGLLVLVFATNCLADTLEERVARLEKEVAALKAQIAASEKTAPSSSEPAKPKTEALVTVNLVNKRFQDVDLENSVLQAGVYWDATYTLAQDAKATRAIKGSLVFTDLFDEVKLRIAWTIDQPLKPGESFTEKDVGIKFNQFEDSQEWLKNTDLKNMKVRFEVENAIYED